MTQPLRLVRVVWEDASVVDDDVWVHRKGARKPKPIHFDQVGWLLELTSDHVILSASVGKVLMSARDRIPAGMIRSITEYSGPGVPIQVPKKRKAA